MTRPRMDHSRRSNFRMARCTRSRVFVCLHGSMTKIRCGTPISTSEAGGRWSSRRVRESEAVVHRPLRWLDETEHIWYCYDDKRSWPNLVVETHVLMGTVI